MTALARYRRKRGYDRMCVPLPARPDVEGCEEGEETEGQDMSSGQKIHNDQAWPFAVGIVDVLRPYCSRVEIAGSLRRKRLEVGDIEIVAISNLGTDLFGVNNPEELAVEVPLSALIKNNVLLWPKKDGQKYKQFEILALKCNLDLFLTTAEAWPVIFSIRTGPWEFSKRLVTPKSKGGYLPDMHRVEDGRVRTYDGKTLGFADERAFIEWAVGHWVEPEDRR